VFLFRYLVTPASLSRLLLGFALFPAVGKLYARPDPPPAFPRVLSDTPVHPAANEEARALLHYLASACGRAMLSGQQEITPWSGTASEEDFDYIRKQTDRVPAVRGFDFMFYTQGARDGRVAERAIEWSRAGGIVHVCLHWKAGSTADLQAFGTGKTDFDLAEALTPGTRDHEEFVTEMDVVALELKKLQKARVPVIWRPFHEVSGGWFWWGAKGPENFIRAWRFMYERYTETHGLDNLLWTYNPTAHQGGVEVWHPGHAYVDIVGYDVYPDKGTHPVHAEMYRRFHDFYLGRKPFALTENGGLPDPDEMFRQNAGWAFFSTWTRNFLTDAAVNHPDFLRRVYQDPRVVNRERVAPTLSTLAPPAVGRPARLLFLTPPAPLARQPAGPQRIEIALVDENARTVRDVSGEIALTLDPAPAGTSPVGRVKLVRGIALFEDLRPSLTGDTLKLVAWPDPALRTRGVEPRTGPTIAVYEKLGAEFATWPAASLPEDTELADLASGRIKTPPARVVARTTEFTAPGSKDTELFGRLAAELVAPADGNYTFFVTADDAGELYLTEPGRAPAPAARPLAACPGYSGDKKWDTFPEQTSRPVALKAGQRLRLTGVYRQRGGGQHLVIGWRLPDGAEEKPIPGRRLIHP
jgi:mannan endo-1,4-beta-mannosidase